MGTLTIARMIFNAFIKPKQQVTLSELPRGRVLDIGGGGEGVIAQAGGSSVVAVDKFRSEIDEARAKAPEACWMVADATALPYTSRLFDHATAFFSCMYMPQEVKEKVFCETFRVLKPGGEFWVWDVNMASGSDVFAFRLQAELPDHRKINTIYGVKSKDQSAENLGAMLQKAGFECEVANQSKHWFLIKARRPLPG